MNIPSNKRNMILWEKAYLTDSNDFVIIALICFWGAAISSVFWRISLAQTRIKLETIIPAANTHHNIFIECCPIINPAIIGAIIIPIFLNSLVFKKYLTSRDSSVLFIKSTAQ